MKIGQNNVEYSEGKKTECLDIHLDIPIRGAFELVRSSNMFEHCSKNIFELRTCKNTSGFTSNAYTYINIMYKTTSKIEMGTTRTI